VQKDWSAEVKPVGVAEAFTIADEVFSCSMVEEAMPKGALYDVMDRMQEMIVKLIDHLRNEKSQT
jgi:hypothetical protein